jgi:histidyl-tRNA synthetase
MAIREKAFNTVTRVFKRHGAVTMDTPVFELREILMSKYGEDSKLIYDLQDQGGELCSLRYDLTVPFARFLAMNKDISSMKRYQIAKSYRRDQPALTKGRLREFYQCDFDIAGAGLAPLLPDAEVFKVIADILTDLDIGQFVIKCSNRLLLDGLFAFCGVPESKFRSTCSAIDKLDKQPWSEVRRELVVDKGIAEDVANRIGELVLKRGDVSMLKELLNSPLSSNESARRGLEELIQLAQYFEIFQISDKIVFDMSLARGLDYYTGVILEAVLIGGEMGSIAGGGRYDDLVGMFMKSGTQVPCVGATVGIERIFGILEAKARQNGKIRPSPTKVFVVAAGGEMTEDRMRLCMKLWNSGINAEMSQKAKLKTLDQFEYCEKNGIPYAVVIGPEEMKAGQVKIRDISTRREEVVQYDQIAEKVKEYLADDLVTESLDSLSL